MIIFDRTVIQNRRRKATPLLEKYDYLYKYCERELLQKLSIIKKSFKKILILGHCTELLSQTLEKLQPLDFIIHCNSITHRSELEKNLHVNADEEFLPFKEQSFDLIISPHQLHTINDVPGVLWQIQRILKPDGLFLASFFGGKTLTELKQIFFEVEAEIRKGSSPRISPFIELATAASLVGRAGFSLPVVDRDILQVTFTDIYQLMHDLKGMGETNALIHREKSFTPRSLFIESAKHYKSKFATSQERIFATFEIFYLTGWAPHPGQQKPLKPGSAQHLLTEALKIK